MEVCESVTFHVLLQGKYLVSEEFCLKICDNVVQKCSNSILILSFVTLLFEFGGAH